MWGTDHPSSTEEQAPSTHRLPHVGDETSRRTKHSTLGTAIIESFDFHGRVYMTHLVEEGLEPAERLLVDVLLVRVVCEQVRMDLRTEAVMCTGHISRCVKDTSRGVVHAVRR